MRATVLPSLIAIAILCAGSAAKTCNNPQCKFLADLFRQTMDLSVNPCTDFYSFMCGKYIQDKTPPKGGYEALSDIVTKDIWGKIFTEFDSKSGEGQPPVFQKAKDFYKSCVDIDAADRLGLAYMKKLVKSYGGWPVLDSNWNSTNFNWIESMRRISMAGDFNEMIVSIGVDASLTNNTRTSIILDQPVWGDVGEVPVDRQYRSELLEGMDNLAVQRYYGTLVKLAVAFGADETIAKRDLMDSLQFEIQLANISVSNEDLRDFSSVTSITTVCKLLKKYPSVAWLPLFRAVLGEYATITGDDIVQVDSPQFVEKLGDLLLKTPNRVIANYMMSQVVYLNGRYLNTQVLNIFYPGRDVMSMRRNYCVYTMKYLVDTVMNPILGAMYVQKYFDKQVKPKATKMIALIKKQLLKVISTTDWLDTATRKVALKKVSNIEAVVGYPDVLVNNTYLDEYYQKLTMDKKNIVQNLLNTGRFMNYQSISTLHKPINPRAWTNANFWGLVTPNAAYASTGNSIDIFVGILIDQYYDVHRPLSLNIGTIGRTVGHELTHSVDDQGGQFDEDGNLRDWWTNKTKQTFKQRAQAVVAEYSTYVIKEINETVNAYNQQGEIIADQGGFKLARMALEEVLAGLPEEPRLVGFGNYTARQLFWMGSAIRLCSSSDEDALRYQNLDVHPVDEIRINGALRNNPDFGKDFNCSVGSYMNPEKKFNVW